MWEILRIYVVGAVKLYMRIIQQQSEQMEKKLSFRIGVGIRRGFVMPLELFSVYMDGVIKLKSRTHGAGAEIGKARKLPSWFFSFNLIIGCRKR